MLNYDKIPVDYMIGGMKRYIEDGILPGDFLHALLTNDLKGTFAHADETNALFIREWVMWLYNECPSVAQGSVVAVNAWVEEKRTAAASKAT